MPRVVLAERLKIFWLVTAKLRKLVQLTFGYEPNMRNVDQSPFHGNEAGSAECNTIALKGRTDSPLNRESCCHQISMEFKLCDGLAKRKDSATIAWLRADV